MARRNNKGRTFRVGRHGKHLAVRTPSAAARARATLRAESLKDHALDDVRRALRDRGLLKYGSGAPDAIVRKIYEDAEAAGEVRAVSSNVQLLNLLSNSGEDSEPERA